MKLSDSYFFTLRENAKDEDSVSSNLLVRAGFIKKSSNGIYMILPMGKRVLRNIENIIRQEMDEHGGQELEMPALINEEVYIDSGRREAFGKNMFALEDRNGKHYVLGPTHEELFAMAAMMDGHSYKDFPYNLYQIQTKYRDETRPRYGLIRVREFTMKDAYSFDHDAQGMDVSYNKMADAYNNIFDRLGLDYKIVRADMGAMGGLLSEEYQALADLGEDVLVLCDECGYATNLEIGTFKTDETASQEDQLEIEKVFTPNSKTIEEVASFFELEPDQFVKTLIYNTDQGPMAFLVPGDRELNETKARNLAGVNEMELADEKVFDQIGSVVGFAGPIGLDIPVFMDESIPLKKNFIVGANEKDHHLKNVNVKDFNVTKTADLKEVKEGDLCPHCGKPLRFARGIEVGNLFKLGTKYSNALDFNYLDANNKLQPVWMGSYGIGLERCMAAVAEQNHDDKGLIWPDNLAPFQIAIVPVSMKNEKQVELANELYEKIRSMGYPVLLDDRNERPGVKFKDMELIGIPYRITVGKGIEQGNLEFYNRKEDQKIDVPIEEIIDKISGIEHQVAL